MQCKRLPSKSVPFKARLNSEGKEEINHLSNCELQLNASTFHGVRQPKYIQL